MEILLYSFSLLVYLVIYLINKHRVFGCKFLDPINIFILSYAFVHFFAGAVQLLARRYQYSSTYSLDAYFLAISYEFFFGLTVVSVYFAFEGIRNSSDTKVFKLNPLIKGDYFKIYLFVVFPAFASLCYIFFYMLQFNYVEFLADRIVLFQGKGIFLNIMDWLPTFIYIIYIEFLNKNIRLNILQKMSVFIVFGLNFLVAAAIGARMRAFTPFLMIVFISFILRLITSKGKKKGFIRLAIAIVIIMISMWQLGNLRSTIKSGGVEEFGKQSLVDGLVGVVSENFRCAENLLWLFDNKNTFDLFWGKTFYAGIVNLIPRQMFPEKPLGAGPILINLIRPGTYDPNSNYITSLTTGIVIEAYMNFGHAGIVLVAFPYALAIVVLKRMAEMINNSIAFAIWLVVVYWLCWVMIFGEFLGTFAHLVTSAIISVFFLNRIGLPMAKRNTCILTEFPLKLEIQQKLSWWRNIFFDRLVSK